MELPTTLIALSLSTCPAFAQVDAIQDLGTIDTSMASRLYPYAISSDGATVVGFEENFMATATAFRWTEVTGPQLLDCPGALASYAFFGSDDGTVAAGAAFPGGPVIWDAMGNPTAIAPAGFEDATINALSGDGSTVVGEYRAAINQVEGFVWSAASGFQLLGGAASTASSVSFDGQVVTGWVRDLGGPRRVFRWTPSGGLQSTGIPTAVTYEGIAVSSDGSTISGFLRTPPAGSTAFVWTASNGYVDLGAPGTGAMFDLWLSDDGSVIMGNESVGFFGRGFRWTAPSGFRWLDTPGGDFFYVNDMNAEGDAAIGVAASASMTHWTLNDEHQSFPSLGAPFPFAEPKALSGDGSAAIGRSTDATGPGRGVIWRPTGTTMGSLACSATAPNSSGQTGRLSLLGSNALPFGRLTITAQQLPPNAFGFFLTSNTTGLVLNPGGSAGTLCLGGSIGRFVGPGQIQQADSGGAMSLDIDASALPSPTGPVAPGYGESWTIQGWHRDTGPAGPTSNLTDAVSVRLY